MRYLLDTNALVYFLEDAVTGFQGIEDGDEVHFSFITRIELFCGNIDKEEIFTITRFLKEFEEFSMDEGIVERTIYVRKKYGLKIPDAIIVATAIEKDLVLITADKEIIKKVDEVKIIDPLQ